MAAGRMVHLAANTGKHVIGLANSVNVAFFAHVGGFVAGMAMAVVYKLVKGEHVIPGRGGPSSGGGGNPWDYWHQAGRGRH